MLSFKCKMKVIKDEEKDIVINNFRYQVFLVKVADLELPAYFGEAGKVCVGDCIESNEVFLTNYDGTSMPKELALRIGKYTIVPKDSFVPMKYLEVRVNGKLRKNNSKSIKRVGVLQKPFLSCYLSSRNETNKWFNILMVSFNNIAKEIDKLPSYAYINVRARLKPKLNGIGYELNVSNFEHVKRKNGGIV